MGSLSLLSKPKPNVSIPYRKRRALASGISFSAAILILAGAGLWSYWTTVADIAARWAEDPRYSHGYFVPLFAAAVLWLRQARWDYGPPQPSAWGGAILATACLLRLVGAYAYVSWLDAVSLLPSCAGLVVLIGGRPGWRWAWPGILFLLFMLPLPHQFEVGLAHPLQRLATVASTYGLQTLGFPALAEGNIIRIEEIKIGVLEACNGLGMLVTFFALSAAFAILVPRPVPDKLILFCSAAPIGVFANVLRIVLTGVLHRTAGSAVANAVFHDIAGWLMMPVAVTLLWLELRLLDRLFIRAEAAAEPPVPNRMVRPEASNKRRRLPPWL